MSHKQRIDSNHRGLFVFLIDQSGSTSKEFGTTGEKMQDAIARVVNEILSVLVTKGNTAERYKCRYDFACLGYGNEVTSAFVATMSNDDILSAEVLFNAGISDYVLSASDGGTDMAKAFSKAKDVISQWIQKENHMDSFPPMIFNITDGDEYTGKDPESIVNEIKKMTTQDGEVLVWNIHVSPTANDAVDTISLLSDDSQLTHPMAKKLFSMSSAIPNSGQFTEYAGKRAFAYNLNSQQLLKLLAIGTLT